VDKAALAGVVVGYYVIFVGDGLHCSVGRRRNRRFALATAYDFDTAMVYRHAPRSFAFEIEKSPCACYN
jgi:hypothetical protein